MAFDFKKEYRALYAPKSRPELVTVPAANYIAVRGRATRTRRTGPISGQSAFCTRLPIP